MKEHGLIGEIVPERNYPVKLAAHYLGIARSTLYDYIRHPDKPLKFTRLSETGKMVFKGSDLVAYKAAGFPKKGRKCKSSCA